MLRAVCLFLAAAGFFQPVAFADAGSDLGNNAALIYWQAFAQLPKLPEAELEKINRDCLTMPIDDHARELVARADYALQMMHYGAAQAQCDWGIAYEAGIGTRLPQAQASRELSALACLRARIRFAEGRNTEALGDLVDCMMLARQISVKSVSIMVLVGYSLEARASQVLAAGMSGLSPEQLKNLQKRLDTLPPGGSPVNALPFEEKSFEISVFRPIQKVNDKEELLKLLSQVFINEGHGSGDREKASKFLEECGGNSAGILAKARDFHESYSKMEQMVRLPMDRCMEAWEQEVKLQANNPIFKAFAGLVPVLRWRQLQAETRMALLAAAIAVKVDGKDALKNRKDPLNGEPLEYVPFEGGFEVRATKGLSKDLITRLKLNETAAQPLTLTVGKRTSSN